MSSTSFRFVSHLWNWGLWVFSASVTCSKRHQGFFHVWLVSCPGYICANEYGYKKCSYGQLPLDTAWDRILTLGKTTTFTLSFLFEKGCLNVLALTLTVNRHWQSLLWNSFGWLSKVFSRMHKRDNKQGWREASWKYWETKSLTNWLCALLPPLTDIWEGFWPGLV